MARAARAPAECALDVWYNSRTVASLRGLRPAHAGSADLVAPPRSGVVKWYHSGLWIRYPWFESRLRSPHDPSKSAKFARSVAVPVSR
jgi:hypothetical protein